MQEGQSIYIPNFFAHGYECLSKNATILYHLDNYRDVKHESGLPFNDKEFDFVIASHVLEHTKEPEHFIKELQSEPIRKMIADMVGNKNNFEGSYVRLEVLNDTHGFWLKPHCDIPEKLISSLIYINDTAEDITLGTDLYNEKLELVDTVPFWHNFGYVFHGPNKWHGMEKGKTIRTERRGIQINYVTFETDWKVE